MNASYQWLKDFTDFDETPAQLRDLITSRAATVDDVVQLRQDLKAVIVARVIEAKPHPNSDHLSVTKVDAGDETVYDVVCGAQNIVVGTLYPFVRVGATLPGGMTIERRKIRGETSEGMLCSARELGLGTDHTGILALDVDVPLGTPFLSAIQVGDTQIVIDVPASRADLLSHEGIAREIAAATGRPLRRPTIEGQTVVASTPFVSEGREAVTAGVTVRVDDLDGAPRYCATVIRGVKVGPSPSWLVQRLEGVGLRSISNVVDVTNYMLHGFGQPMHAFDLNKLGGSTIVVRKAKAGETLVTLDGVTRTLTDAMTVIADATKPQAIAGIIGGQGSEVDASTTDLVLEVAVFNPKSIRATRKALGVSTDASYRFERAMDAQACEEFARYAAALIVSLAGGRINGTPVIVGTSPAALAAVLLRPSRVALLLGEPVPADMCTTLLQSIGFTVVTEGADLLRITPPSWRADVTLEVDLIEEVARLRGYDTFSDRLRPFLPGNVPDAPSYTVTARVVETLVAAGLYEVRPLPFVADAGSRGVRVLNPLAENEGMLRSNVLDTLSRRVEYNFSHMVRNVRLFEIGVAFTQSDTNRPTERTLAAVVLTGDRFPAHFTEAKPPQVDRWDAKWIAERIGDAAFGPDRLTLRPNDEADGWDAVVDGQTVGFAKPIAVDAPVWAASVFGIEIDITGAFEGSMLQPRYRPLPTTPAADFDLALLVPDAVSAAQVEQAIRRSAGDLLESLVPFDEFRGEGVGSGVRSVAWRLTLRHPERTLREKEIEGRRAKILQTLDQELSVRYRTS
ncbi:MAG TPA: phenylalanine--tRNA ligase subunit beta [Gemmatimonadaceae bacterium]|jgi:phenylalanyl-tRNA synthetase beta chain|nr:phenylalanine--tRNA ligase subunit beta [Gemmatimonadaceae bacterium]